MNKFQAKQLITIKTYIAMNNDGAAARSLSALVRSAMRQSQKTALLAEANALGLNNHPDFVV